jgi:lipopolysaccharide transport system ATP-binding protein
MADVAIRADRLSKRYRIGASRRSYGTLRDALSDGLAATLRTAYRLARARPHHTRTDNTIWALKDVTFEIAPGEAVGIIGRNGSGKSTLLKLLSRITRPTTGSAQITGRVGSLLEVGTGFHPELTGRDNIYLNGAILGMKRTEIKSKFDEIVSFAEVDRFIDTPVKHYSSGMYLRLAFAVAAHLESEILFVDEILAVGDEAFQKRCLGKMDDVSKAGRTVLFVSHNLQAVSALTRRALILDGGKLLYVGETPGTLERYRAFISSGEAGNSPAPHE